MIVVTDRFCPLVFVVTAVFASAVLWLCTMRLYLLLN
jgi:hypothetical protein